MEAAVIPRGWNLARMDSREMLSYTFVRQTFPIFEGFAFLSKRLRTTSRPREGGRDNSCARTTLVLYKDKSREAKEMSERVVIFGHWLSPNAPIHLLPLGRVQGAKHLTCNRKHIHLYFRRESRGEETCPLAYEVLEDAKTTRKTKFAVRRSLRMRG